MWPFRKREPATYAKPPDNRFEITASEVTVLMIIVARWSDDFPIEKIDDAGMAELIHRCREARRLVRNGHKVSIFIPFGDYHE